MANIYFWLGPETTQVKYKIYYNFDEENYSENINLSW